MHDATSAIIGSSATDGLPDNSTLLAYPTDDEYRLRLASAVLSLAKLKAEKSIFGAMGLDVITTDFLDECKLTCEQLQVLWVSDSVASMPDEYALTTRWLSAQRTNTEHELKPGESDALEELTQAIASRWQSRKDFPSSYADQKVSGMTRTAKSLRVSLEEARINGPISFLGTAVEGNLHSRRRDGLTDLGFPCVVDGVGRVSSGINTHERWTRMAAEGRRGIQAAAEAEARRPFDL